jgi:sodium/potassium-transporting ATPase subunit alpha
MQSSGLKPAEAFERSQVYGPNTLTPPKRKHVLIKFLECLGNMFNVMLILAGILEYILLAMDPVENFANVIFTHLLFILIELYWKYSSFGRIFKRFY